MSTGTESESLSWQASLLAGLAAFAAYFSMYALRKPFSVGTYPGAAWEGTTVTLKSAFVISQLLGYAASKYVGIRVCSESGRHSRAVLLISLVCVAEAGLLLFGWLPPEGKIAAIFLNGLPLGMVWGLLIRYIEGRRTTEMMLGLLSLSYIVASGIVKDLGNLALRLGVSEYWMPAVLGGIFLPVFVASVGWLHALPPPGQIDARLRAPRPSLDRSGRIDFLRRHWTGLVPLLILICGLTAYRDLRDNFGAELLSELGCADMAGAFTIADLPAAVSVIGTLALLSLVQDAGTGLRLVLTTMAGGLMIAAAATALFDAGLIPGLAWMILLGLGGYLTYVPFGAMLFDRMIAYTRYPGTAAFAIALADAVGYTGSVGIYLVKDTLFADLPRVAFFRLFTYGLSVIGLLLLALAGRSLLTSSRPELERTAT